MLFFVYFECPLAALEFSLTIFIDRNDDSVWIFDRSNLFLSEGIRVVDLMGQVCINYLANNCMYKGVPFLIPPPPLPPPPGLIFCWGQNDQLPTKSTSIYPTTVDALWVDTLVSGQLNLRLPWQNPAWTLSDTNSVSGQLRLRTLFLLLEGVYLRELRLYFT